MPHPEREHSLQIEVARLQRECNALHSRLTSEKERADRGARDLAETLDALSKTTDRTIAAQKERDALRTALTEVNDLLMSVPPGEDWRAVVREKVVVALFGEAAWQTK